MKTLEASGKRHLRVGRGKKPVSKTSGKRLEAGVCKRDMVVVSPGVSPGIQKNYG